MNTIYKDQTPVEFDSEGFVINPLQWDHAVAEQIAWRDGINQLSEDQWGVVDTIRTHYNLYGALPDLRYLCIDNGLKPHCVKQLFGTHPEEVCRIAGIPNPGEVIKSYLA